MAALIVYGPQASGKTLNAQKIAERYGCTSIVDGHFESLPFDDLLLEREKRTLKNESQLILTNRTKEEMKEWLAINDLESSVRLISIYETGLAKAPANDPA